MELNEKTYILSIETTGTVCSAVLTQKDQLISEYTTNGANLHDKLIAEYSRRILNDRDLKIADLSAVAISAGPGSFTGLRIGSALAKALTFSDDVKLISVPTLTALAKYTAFNSKPNSRIIASQYSHKDLLYYQIFNNCGDSVSEIAFTSISEFESILKEDDFLCGSHHLPKYASNKLDFLSARHIAFYALELYQKAAFIESESFVPAYVQDFTVKN